MLTHCTTCATEWLGNDPCFLCGQPGERGIDQTTKSSRNSFVWNISQGELEPWTP